MTTLHARSATEYGVTDLCALFGVSKQAYYKYDENTVLARSARESFALQFIHDVRRRDPGIGGMKLWFMYRDRFNQESPIGRDCFCEIIDRHNLKVRFKRRKPKTTDSTHGLPTYPNIVKDLIPTSPNQLWVSDITYIVIIDSDTSYHFCYLSLILDAFTEEIIGWSVGPTLDTQYPLAALKMALKRVEGKGDIGLIHHSDRGCQYASNEYVRELQSHNIQISMTECGDPKDNAQAERINNTMKNELLKDKVFRHIDEVIAAISVAVDFYNNERPHMSIGMLTPVKAANLTGDRDMKWKSFRMEAIKRKLSLEIPEICLPLHPCQGPPSGQALQSTPDRNKDWSVNKTQGYQPWVNKYQ